MLHHLRRQIVTGQTPPGTRLPTRIELESQFNVSWLTVQRAFDRLKRDGFVRSRGRHGTFVTEHPPHLCRYGLLLESDESEQPTWSRFWTALCNEAATIERGGSQRFCYYHNVTAHADSEDYQKLMEDVRARRLAGVIIGFPPAHLIGTTLLEDPDLPRVALMLPTAPGVPVLEFDYVGFMDKAVDFLHSKGCRRVALIDSPKASSVPQDRFHSALAARGMTTHPYWVHTLTHSFPESAQTCAHLMFQSNQTERPDGLIISDDNLVESAVSGIIAAGVKVPDELQVVAHANFPWPPPSALPVTRLGCDTHRALLQCMEMIDAQQRGETPPQHVSTAAVFENETSR